MIEEASNLPTGTVTFLFTDIEGSTRLLQELGDWYAKLLSDQRKLMREILSKWNGTEIDTQGDAFFVSFPRATDAVEAAAEIQQALLIHSWPEDAKVSVRMGLHTGEPLVAEEGYVGIDVHRAARIGHVGHGGQVLLSETTAPLVRDELPQGVKLLDLGRHLLKDVKQPEHIRQLVIDGHPSRFPGLKSLGVLQPEVIVDLRSDGLPAFLEVNGERAPAPVFVGRERELGRLSGFLKKSLGGNGGIVFLTGGPGRGKTALMRAFIQHAIKMHPDLLSVSGNCSAYTGIGDPYLPFRDGMKMLTGDLESHWASNSIGLEHAIRLWAAMPIAVQAIVEHGQDLIDVFMNGRTMLARSWAKTGGAAVWLERLSRITSREHGSPRGLDQIGLFEQFEQVMAEIARKHPLLLILDDLQWADQASINLLFHIGKRLSGRRILILASYRPEEVAGGRLGDQHPLEKVLAEFKRQYGDVWIDLNEIPDTEGLEFVEEVIDSESNQLPKQFRDALYEHTDGHPLFTVELLRDLQERGDLVRDKKGQWIERSELDWTVLPARVEGVIEERIGRLEDDLRETLTIASVEGEDFTAQVVARVRGVDERGLVRNLSRELDKKHHLVKELGSQQVATERLFLYRFRHALFQQHLYNGLSVNERALLHGDVGKVLEGLHGIESDEIAPQLAWHFEEAGETAKAIGYLEQAAKRAIEISANQEAIAHLKKGLDLLRLMPDTLDRTKQELILQIPLSASLMNLHGYSAPEVGEAFTRALELSKRHDYAPSEFIPAYYGLRNFHFVSANHEIALDMAKDITSMAKSSDDPALVRVIGHMGQTSSHSFTGEFKKCLENVETLLANYQPYMHQSLIHQTGHNLAPIGMAFASVALQWLGFLDQAALRFQRSVDWARELDHPYTLAFVLGLGSILHPARQDPTAAWEITEELIPFAEKHGFAYWVAFGTVFRGWALAELGEVDNGIKEIHHGIELFHDTGARLRHPDNLIRLSGAYSKAGNVEKGLDLLDEAQAIIEKTGERIWEAELHLNKGKMLLARGKAPDEVKPHFLKSIDVAHLQKGNLWGLQATVELCKLWLQEGRKSEAKVRLSEIYSWFTEGFDAVPLREAKMLLDELSN